jgi:hypothetical protein
MVDATCGPADIRYPNDLGILNQAREQTEEIIDSLYEPIKDKFPKKPKTYREQARKAYLEVAKRRRPSQKQQGTHPTRSACCYAVPSASHFVKWVEILQ